MFTLMQRVETISVIIWGHLTFVGAITTLIDQLRVGFHHVHNQKVRRWVGGGETFDRTLSEADSQLRNSGWKEKSSE
jgi:hypothetical protein